MSTGILIGVKTEFMNNSVIASNNYNQEHFITVKVKG